MGGKRARSGAARPVLAQEQASGHGGTHIGAGPIMAGVICGDAAVTDGALGALGISVEAVRLQLRLLREIRSWARQAPSAHRPFPPRPGKMPESSLRETLQLARNYIGTEPTLQSLTRDGQAAGAQVLMRLAADLNRIRQQVTGLLPGYPGEGEPGLTRDAEAGRAELRLVSELPGRVGSVESRLSIVEHRVGTGPDVAELDRQIEQARADREAAADAQDYENAAVLRDRERQLTAQKTSRQDEWAAAHLDLPSLAEELRRMRDEIVHLRDLLSQHDIQPQDGTA
jgi:ATP-dependent Clp protease ATP-binding subunit ClpA